MRRAFTLVEMMIAVAIIIIMVTIALPGIVRSRIVAHEGAAIANMKIISNACQLYHIDNDSYPDSLNELATSDPPYLDEILAKGKKAGYRFSYESTEEGFEVKGDPTGLFASMSARHFFVDESGVIRSKTGGVASVEDEIVR